MIRNFITVTLRSLTRNKLHAFINISGLAIGMTCFVLIALFLRFELSYDKQNKDASRIYRMAVNLEANNWAISAFPIGELLQNNFEEVQKFTRIKPSELFVLNSTNDIKSKERVFFADSSVFDVLDIKLVKGDPSTALAEINSIVLTPQRALAYFGNEDPIGKTLTLLNNKQEYKVTGIFEPLPSNSHVHIDVMVSSDNLAPMRRNSPDGWNYLTNHYTYLVLPEGIDHEAFEKKISAFMDKHFELTPDQPKNDIRLQPLTSIHLTSNRGLEVEANGNMNTVYVMSAVGFFILVIACINFMNLTTAQSLKRAREVGVRKVVGSNKSQLIFQFLNESIVISVIAMILSALLLILVVPVFNEVSGKQIVLNPLVNLDIVLIMVGVTIFVGLAAGIYPAFFLSNFKPTSVLKGNFVSGLKGQILRKGLVVFQFAIAFLIIVGTFVIYSQLNYMLNKNLGFDREQVLVLRMSNDSIADVTMKTEVQRLAGVQSVTRFNEIPGRMVRTSGFWYEGVKDNQPENLYQFSGDVDLLETLGMKMKAGKYFDKNTQQFEREFVINETAAKHFGWKIDEAVGKLMSAGDRGSDPGKVIGVIEDFHFKHLHDKIDPLVMYLQPGYEGAFLGIKVKSENMSEMIAAAERTWKSVLPEREFEYQFLDESFNQLFTEEKRLGQLFGIFAGLAIFISCLGLFGLASFTMEQNKKSVAIRKVLGASVPGILVMMSRGFLKLVILGILIAAPLSWYLMTKWLSGFAYNAGLTWVVFAYAAIMAIVVALLTVSYHSLKAAVNNPVIALKEN